MSIEKDRATHKGHPSIYIEDLLKEVEETDDWKSIRELSYKDLEQEAENLKKFFINQVDGWLAEWK